MENKNRGPGLSPITKEWLKAMQQNYREERRQAPISIDKDITKGPKWREQNKLLLEHIEVRRPRSQCKVSRQQSPSPEHRCICQREKTSITCNKCDFRYVGRVRKTCPDHPRTFFLMDLVQCPKCFSTEDLVEEND